MLQFGFGKLKGEILRKPFKVAAHRLVQRLCRNPVQRGQVYSRMKGRSSALVVE